MAIFWSSAKWRFVAAYAILMSSHFSIYWSRESRFLHSWRKRPGQQSSFRFRPTVSATWMLVTMRCWRPIAHFASPHASASALIIAMLHASYGISALASLICAPFPSNAVTFHNIALMWCNFSFSDDRDTASPDIDFALEPRFHSSHLFYLFTLREMSLYFHSILKLP